MISPDFSRDFQLDVGILRNLESTSAQRCGAQQGLLRTGATCSENLASAQRVSCLWTFHRMQNWLWDGTFAKSSFNVLSSFFIMFSQTVCTYLHSVYLYHCKSIYMYVYYLHLPMYVKLSLFHKLVLVALFSASKLFLYVAAFAVIWRFETVKQSNETAKKMSAKKNRNGEKKWKRRHFKQAAIISVVSDCEQFYIGGRSS